MKTALLTPIRFTVPPGSEATSPPEHRGVARDGVRLLVAAPDGIRHRRFRDLADILAPGDLLVVNTSATLPAAVDGIRRTGERPVVHVAGERDDGTWTLEFRRADNTGPLTDIATGERIELAGGLCVTVRESFPEPGVDGSRLWVVTPGRVVSRLDYLADHGRPIRYGYLSGSWPLRDLQNVYADQPGSAEMASAGRPFSARLLIRLMARGVVVAPLVLHTGVSSPEKHEPPSPGVVRPPGADRRPGQSHPPSRPPSRRRRDDGDARPGVGRRPERHRAPGLGWTDLVLGPHRPARVVTGLISGLHEPEASHLSLLEAVAGRRLVQRAYDAVERPGYLWHEFGDSMLFLPASGDVGNDGAVTQVTDTSGITAVPPAS